MAAVTTLMRKPPVLSPERQALAAKIEESRALAVEVAELSQAAGWSGTARAAISVAQRVVAEAELALEAAKRRAVSAAMGHHVDGLTVREARAELIDAQDVLDAAMATYAAVEARLKDAGDRQTSRRRFGDVKQAAVVVLKSEGSELTAKLLDRAERAQREVIAAGLALGWLDNFGMWERRAIPDSGGATVTIDQRAGGVLARFGRPPSEWSIGSGSELQTHIRLALAMDLLMADATAPLPSLD